jgi:hypothetical protein
MRLEALNRCEAPPTITAGLQPPSMPTTVQPKLENIMGR